MSTDDREPPAADGDTPHAIPPAGSARIAPDLDHLYEWLFDTFYAATLACYERDDEEGAA